MSHMHESIAVVFEFKNSLFMIKRQPYLKAFPGYYAFPGGKIEGDDHHFLFEEDVKKLWNSSNPIIHFSAIIREVQEELNFDIIKNKDKISSIGTLGIACTPSFNPVRYNTYFYCISLKEQIHFNINDGEIENADWRSLAKWKLDYEEGQLLLVPPILNLICNFKEILLKCEKSKRPYDLSLKIPKGQLPNICPMNGLNQIIVRSNTLPPAKHTNCFVIGDDPNQRIAIDPAPYDRSELMSLIETLKVLNPSEIFLTHHHKDHHENVLELSKYFDLSVGMSRDTHTRILNKWGKDYFGNQKIKIYRSGDSICHWLGKDVKVFSVPGHDEGQLALMSEGKEWMLVGDLIQGIGTVIIAAPEGDMVSYYHSLDSVIKFDPKVILPSHGIAMGGTYRIKAALAHRKKREEVICSLYQKGLSEKEILDEVYKDVTDELKWAALENIKSHLKKLEKEKRI